MKKLILMNQARLGQLGEWLIGGPLVPEHKLGDTRFRFDFYFPNPRVALEFDGPEHYSKVDHIDRDQRKLETATREGISIIRWPYYLQMSREVTAALFGTNFWWTQQISDSAKWLVQNTRNTCKFSTPWLRPTLS